MAIDVVLNTISSGYNLAKINENFTLLDTALQDAVSRSGVTPNTMSADLDMNSNYILNAQFPTSVLDFGWQGAWVTTTVYALNEVVEEAGSSYICIEAHTAGVFATDLAANKWELLAEKGDTGATGSAGATGATGSTGATGAEGLVWLGTYNAGTAYIIDDAVAYNGSSFICIQAGTGQTPAVGGTAYWDDLANKGADGAGAGDVSGPASSTNNSLARFDGATGKLLKDGAIIGTDVQAYDATIVVDADIGSTVQAYDVDTLKADTSDNLVVGFTTDELAHGTIATGTVTVDLTDESIQTLTNNGAFTLAPPASGQGVATIFVTNDSSAGAITTSGFDKVTGDALTTTDTEKFMLQVIESSVASVLNIVDLN